MYTQRRNENFGMPGAGSWTCSSNRRLPIQRHGLVARADCLNFAAFLSVHLELEGGSHPLSRLPARLCAKAIFYGIFSVKA